MNSISLHCNALGCLTTLLMLFNLIKAKELSALINNIFLMGIAFFSGIVIGTLSDLTQLDTLIIFPAAIINLVILILTVILFFINKKVKIKS